MKTRILALLALLAAAVPVRTQAQLAPVQIEVSKWVERFLAEEPDQFERADLIKKLSRANRTLVNKPLKAAIVVDTKRVHALELAVALKVPGLFDTAKKYADGSDEEAVIKLALATLDKGAAAWALERWKAKEAKSPSWKFADAAFHAYPVPIDTFKQFKDFASAKGSDEAKLLAAVEILAFQLGTDVPEKPADLLSQWDKLKTSYEADSKVFPLTGVDMLNWPDVGVGGGAKHVFNNFRMVPGSSLQLEIPAEWNAASFTLNMQVRWVSGSDFKLGLMTDKIGQYLELNSKGEWSVPSFKDGKAFDYTLKAKAGTWAKITLKVTADPAVKDKRTSKMTVDDKEFHFGDLPLDGKFTYLRLDAFKTDFALAALEWIVGK